MQFSIKLRKCIQKGEEKKYCYLKYNVDNLWVNADTLRIVFGM